jgi:hypothetical protein
LWEVSLQGGRREAVDGSSIEKWEEPGPRGIDRIDRPKIKGEQWHAHLGPGEGSPAINIDGTWKHPNGITEKQKEFLRKAGWKI